MAEAAILIGLVVLLFALGPTALVNMRATARTAWDYARSSASRLTSINLDRWWPVTFAVGILIGVVVMRGLPSFDWWKWLPDNVPSILTPVTKPTAAVYIYEKDQGSVPSGVGKALDTLNRQGLLATAFEDDTTDGDGDVPDQYKVPLAAAREAGLPALVVMSKGEVRRVVKVATEEQVLEAVK